MSDPKIVVFCCNWSVYPGLQLSDLEGEPNVSAGTIVTMCTGRIDPELILEAFDKGAWGVMIAACPLGECEHDGNYKTLRRVMLLRKMLKQLNIEPERVRLEYIGTGEVTKLNKAIREFRDSVVKLGPLGSG